MILVLHIGFLLGFGGGFLLSIVLFFKDAAALVSKDKHACFWETRVSLFFSFCQAGLSIAGIIASRVAFTADTEPRWPNAVILCALQLFIGTNLAWTVRGHDDSHRAIWLAYGSIVWTAPDVAFLLRYIPFLSDPDPSHLGRGTLVYEYELMSRGTIASVVPLALWCHARRTHTLSGAHDRHYVRKQEWFIVTNATSTIFQLFGTIAFYSLSLAELNSSNLRQCIVLACLLVQAANLFLVCKTTVKYFFIQYMAAIPHHVVELSRRSVRTGSRDLEGAVRLDSL